MKIYLIYEYLNILSAFNYEIFDTSVVQSRWISLIKEKSIKKSCYETTNKRILLSIVNKIMPE